MFPTVAVWVCVVLAPMSRHTYMDAGQRSTAVSFLWWVSEHNVCY